MNGSSQHTQALHLGWQVYSDPDEHYQTQTGLHLTLLLGTCFLAGLVATTTTIKSIIMKQSRSQSVIVDQQTPRSLAHPIHALHWQFHCHVPPVGILSSQSEL